MYINKLSFTELKKIFESIIVENPELFFLKLRKLNKMQLIHAINGIASRYNPEDISYCLLNKADRQKVVNAELLNRF